MEQRHLCLNVPPTLLGDVNKVQNRSLNVGKRRDSAHLNSVSLVERPVQNSRGVDHLPPAVLIVKMSNEEGLGGEGIRFDLHSCIGHLIHEARLANIRVPRQDQGPSGRVNRRQPGEMLPDFLKVRQRRLELLHRSAHTSQTCSLEHLALVCRVCVLQQTDVVLRDVVDDVAYSRNLAESQLVVIPVIQDIAEVRVEGMDVVESGKFLQDV
mmetsp:Transcript_3081/g.6284  ORF Transcript_3081/g.6284 Transcript_3081/m.6284 type:complete len:211 (-) Transcript_3081:382-1014(-)